MSKASDAWSGQQLTSNQSAGVTAALNNMVNASITNVADTFGLPASAISPTIEGIRTFLQANSGTLSPTQVHPLQI